MKNVHNDHRVSPVDTSNGPIYGPPNGSVGFYVEEVFGFVYICYLSGTILSRLYNITDWSKIFFLINVYMRYESDVKFDTY